MDDEPPRSGRGREVGWLAVLFVATAGVYWFVPGYDLLVTWDDALYVLDRSVVEQWWQASWSRRLLTSELGYPVPIPTAIYAVAHEWFEANLGPVLHGVNLAVHLLNLTLVYALLRRWIDRSIAVVAVAVWGLHPLLVEAVASVTYLKTLWCATSALGASLAWELYLEAEAWPWAAVAAAVGLLGLGGWPVAAMIGPMLALQTWTFAGSDDGCRPARWLVPLGIAGVTVAVYLPVAFTGQHQVVEQVNANSIYQIGWSRYLTRLGAAWTLQLQQIVWPVDLHPGYYPSVSEQKTLAAVGAVLGAGAVAGTAWLVRYSRAAALGAGFFWLYYLPVSGIEIVPRFAADAYMYLPLVGVGTIVGLGVERALESRRPWLRSGVIGVGLGCLVGSAALAHVQTWRWQSARALWAPTVGQYPDARFPKLQIAHDYVERGQFGKARKIYESVSSHLPAPRKPIELAGVYARTGEPRRAVDLAVEILSAERRVKPGSWEFLVQTCAIHGIELPDQGKHRRIVGRAAEEAFDQLRRSESAEALAVTAGYLYEQGLTEIAETYADAAIDKDRAVCEKPSAVVDRSEGRELLADRCRAER